MLLLVTVISIKKLLHSIPLGMQSGTDISRTAIGFLNTSTRRVRADST